MDRDTLERLSKDDLITLVLAQAAQIAMLTERVAALEAKLGLPPKTPDNSSLPPSKGQKPSLPSVPKRKAKPHPGAHRLLHPDPTRHHDVLALSCRACGADVSGAEQSPCEVYDRVEIPAIVPDVTRVSLHGGTCPCCAKRFKAEAPAGLEPGSPFGPNIRAFVIYLRAVQGIPLGRLRDALLDLFGLTISEGALVNMLSAGAAPFKTAVSLIKARLLGGTAIASDETGVRVGRANWWLWVFHHGDSAVFVADAHRSKAVVEAFLGDHRPDFWTSDRLGAQAGWARKAASGLPGAPDPRRPVRHRGRRRRARARPETPARTGLRDRAAAGDPQGSTLKAYEADLERRLDRIMALDPTHPAGIKLKRMIRKVRAQLFVFVQNRNLEATNNGSERALRPCAVYRKITNGFRQEWGAHLYADIRSVIETARRRSIRAIDAIRLTLKGEPLLPTAPASA